MIEPSSKLEARVFAAAARVLAADRRVDPLQVLMEIGWMHAVHDRSWKQRLVPDLETTLMLASNKLPQAAAALRHFCEDRGLAPLTVPLLDTTRERQPLRVTRAGTAEVEQVFATHWLPSSLSGQQRARVEQKLTKAPDVVVFVAFGGSRCTDCGAVVDDGDLCLFEGDERVCLACAGLDHLVFLPRGDVALTRRSRSKSPRSAVVMRFNRSRKRNERQGVLVEEAALHDAEASLLTDVEVRERQRQRAAARRLVDDDRLVTDMAGTISRLFPGCPDATAIAAHTAERRSGRVGRSGAGRALDDAAVTLAVIAHVRHRHTGYDALLAAGVDRRAARDRIRDDVEHQLAAWRTRTPG